VTEGHEYQEQSRNKDKNISTKPN